MAASMLLLLLLGIFPMRGEAFVTSQSFLKHHDSGLVYYGRKGRTERITSSSGSTTTSSPFPLLSLYAKGPTSSDDDVKDLPPPSYEALVKFRADIAKYLKICRKNDLKELAGDLKHQFEYQEFAQGFNRRFKPRPYFVVLCRCKEDVQMTFVTAKKYNIPVRIRASGHDHEGESSGDGLIVIDVSNMDHVKVDMATKIAHIGPGNQFKDLTTKLANQNVMVPHGTCGTVAIAGFTMGGGWGPYTRSQGMCCEHLIGATVVLGNGNFLDIDVDEEAPENDKRLPELLWALRGGGGFSYGLVTELRIRTFHLAEELIRFNITWNPYPDEKEEHPKTFPDCLSEDVTTLEVLKQWESSIVSCETPKLIGTNLQVTGRPRTEDIEIDYTKVYNNCIMYGYWEGNCEDLKTFVCEWYGKYALCNLGINPTRGGTGFSENKYGENLMTDWHRISTAPVLRAAAKANPERFSLGTKFDRLIKEGRPLPSDVDIAAPHKITNRLVDNSGLQEDGFKAYIESMWSPLIMPGNRNLGLNQYATLGAISGDYYKQNPDENSNHSSFPYKDKLYTIQYQTWWNLNITEAEPDPIEGPVYTRTNRALDWIQEARDYSIPNTSGSFISFKDSSIPTKTYFQQNYERLVEAKKGWSMDPNNYFRSRKTII